MASLSSRETFHQSQSTTSDKPELHEPIDNDPESEIRQKSTSSPAEIVPSQTPSKQWDDSWNDKSFWPIISKSAPTPASVFTGWTLPTNQISQTAVEKYVCSILEFENDSSPGFERVSCPSKLGSRYSLLRDQASGSGQVQYFFALNPHQSTGTISRLMSSIVEAIRFLGPEHYARFQSWKAGPTTERMTSLRRSRRM